MEFNFDKAVATAHLEDSGWDLDEFNHSNPFKSHFIYICDYRNDHTRLFSIKRTDFAVVNLPLDLTPQILASVITQFVQKISEGTLTPKENNQLAPALIGYTKATETFRSWRTISDPGERLHLLINIYANTGILRPFIARPAKIVLTSEEVLAFSQHIQNMDADYYPEMFRDWKST